jgi:hypothetical protein
MPSGSSIHISGSPQGPVTGSRRMRTPAAVGRLCSVPGDRLANADSAPGIRCPARSPSRGEIPDPERTYGGPLGRRCCTFLLYSLFDSFEFRF